MQWPGEAPVDLPSRRTPGHDVRRIQHPFQDVATVRVPDVQQNEGTKLDFVALGSDNTDVGHDMHRVPVGLGFPIGEKAANGIATNQLYTLGLEDGVVGEQLDARGGTARVDRSVVGQDHFLCGAGP